MENKPLIMVNITHKNNTLRKAVATATVQVSLPATIETVQQGKVPKGDIFEFSRAAGLLAVKKTSDAIPDCHPLPVEYTAISYAVEGLSIIIRVEVHTVYKTGVEVEAMHGAAITAITMYDMLKPIDKGVCINTIQLQTKTGGKSGAAAWPEGLLCAVVVCSDTAFKGEKKDTAGKMLIQLLQQYRLETQSYEVIPDELPVIQDRLKALGAAGFDLVLFTGGTGVSPRDATPDAVRPLLDTEIPGIMETARQYGQNRMPYAMLSRGVAGFMQDTLVITLPGSANGVQETVNAIFPQVLHAFAVKKGEPHNGNL